MAAKIQVVQGPLGPRLIERLLDDLHAEPTVGGSVWLAPSELAAAEIRKSVGSSHRAQNVWSLEAFARELFPSGSTASAFRRRVNLEHVTRDLHAKDKLEYFSRVVETRGFFEGAMQMLDEFEAAAAKPQELRKALKGKPSAKLNECGAIFEAFEKHREERASLADIVAELGPALPERFSKVDTVFLSGFTSFTEAERRFLKWLAERVATIKIAISTQAVAAGDSLAGLEITSETLAPSVSASKQPSGLQRLLGNLFTPKPEPGTDAAGLSLIEAPGDVGEARLVARRIRTLLADGASPDAIVVTSRDLTHSFDLLEEVFEEYGILSDVSCEEPLSRVPAVRTLIQALRLLDEDFPFAGVTALLRSTYFQPAWTEADCEMPLKTESLLRMLGEPRGREAYLGAVESWRISPPQALEDEQAEDSLRRKKTRMATECQPFVKRFFSAWDAFPKLATHGQFVAFAKQFSIEMGIEATASSDERDRTALQALWATLVPRGKQSITRQTFLRLLGTAATSEMRSRWKGTPGLVRIVPAGEARHLDCDYLFVLGLGEGSFPRLSLPGSLLDDGDRQRLRNRGIALPDPASRLAEEQLLFRQLIAQPREGLILSYPALDEKGQPMLPGSFLRAVHACFVPNAISTERQKMLIEGYTKQTPLSVAESRTRFAFENADIRKANWRSLALPPDLCEQLSWSANMAQERFRTKEYGRFDGLVDRPEIVEVVQKRLGVEKVFSPTALETYVACPFRFMIEHVLKLGELGEPSEEVEQTRRGSAYHRALSRLHKHLNSVDPLMSQTKLPDVVGSRLREEIDVAVGEYAKRAPSRASQKLWELEGKRLHRSVARYQGHWDDFLEPLRKSRTAPRPIHLEADFGFPSTDAAESFPALTITVGEVEVRLGGRIDRVDVAELEEGLGFWVIDYKTGRASNYTGGGLAQMEKLQLSLYALAVEKVFYPGRKARPLGLAYWLVTDTGPKQVMPKKTAWLNDPEQWAVFREQLEAWVAKLVGRIRLAQFPLAPRSENCTDTCSFAQMCRVGQSRGTGKEFDLRLPGEEAGVKGVSLDKRQDLASPK